MRQFQSQAELLPNLGFPYKKWLFVWFLILLLENCVVPLALYYGLRYGTRTKPWLICTIVSCVWGLILYVEYAIRVWRLTFRWSTYQPLTSSCIAITMQNDCNDCTIPRTSAEENLVCRPPSIAVSAPNRQHCDASHWLFSVTLAVTLAELIIAPIPKDPYIKLLAMVNPSMLFSICLFIFLLDVASFMHIRAPFRTSSVAKGELVRPGIYTLLEDVIAVDLGGGYTFRTKFNKHWKVSLTFRRLLFQLSIIWSLPGLLVSGACTVVIFRTDTEVGFAVGWGLPFLWAILWTAITAMVVIRGLNKEKLDSLGGN